MNIEKIQLIGIGSASVKILNNLCFIKQQFKFNS